MIVACKARPTSNTHPSESQIADERARVARGDSVGESLKSPAILIDSAKLSVGDETIATGPISVAHLAPFRAHLDALREHWTKIHPFDAFAGAPAVTIAPQVPAEIALAGLRTLAEAGFVSPKVSVGTETLGLDLASPGGATVDVIEVRGHEITTWFAGKDCHVIMTADKVDDVAVLPPHFGFASIADSKLDIHVIVRPGTTTAAELIKPLRRLMATPLLTAHHGKLRFDFEPVFCPSDKKFGHAN